MALLSRISGLFGGRFSPKRDRIDSPNDRDVPEPEQTPPKRKASMTPESSTGGDSTGAKKIKLESELSEIDGNELTDDFSTEANESHLFGSLSPDVDAGDSTEIIDEMEYAKQNLDTTLEFDPVLDRLARERQADELRGQGWSESAVELFSKLDAIGREPLLPMSWSVDLQTVPEALFSTEDKEVFVKSTSGKDFRAAKALSELVGLGPRVRDAKWTKDRAYHSVTKKGIEKYLKWAYQDADLNVASGSTRKSLDRATSGGAILPIVVIEASSGNTPMEVVEAAVKKKLLTLGERWKMLISSTGADCEPPTLFAVICTWAIVGFVAYEIDAVNADGEPFLRTISTFQFSEKGHDVWNSLRVSIFGNHVKNEMAGLNELTGFGKAEDVDVDENDPDA